MSQLEAAKRAKIGTTTLQRIEYGHGAHVDSECLLKYASSISNVPAWVMTEDKTTEEHHEQTTQELAEEWVDRAYVEMTHYEQPTASSQTWVASIRQLGINAGGSTKASAMSNLRRLVLFEFEAMARKGQEPPWPEGDDE